MLGEFFATTIGKLLVIDVVIQWAAFLVANYYKTEKFYDLTGTTNHLLNGNPTKKSTFLLRRVAKQSSRMATDFEFLFYLQVQ